MLEISALCSGYEKLQILHGVSARFRKGEISALFGPNGAGKSTLAKTIFGLLAVVEGQIIYENNDIGKAPPEQRRPWGMGYVPQENNVFPWLTVEDNIRVSVIGLGTGAQSMAFEQAYETFAVLGDRRKQTARTLSGGERQMLALACAMAHEPKFLLVDEPTSGLAPLVVDQLIEQIIHISKTRATVVWIVGDDAIKILPSVHRGYLMKAGVVVGDWSGRELSDHSKLNELFFE